MTKKTANDAPADFGETVPAEVQIELATLPPLSASQFDIPAPADGSEAPATFDPDTYRSALDNPQHPLRHLKDA